MVKLTLSAVHESLKKAVEQRGLDYIYVSPSPVGNCMYSTKDGAPSCIVGMVLADLDPETFAAVKDVEWSLGHSWGVYDFGAEDDDGEEATFPRITEDEDVMDLLSRAQITQDAKASYREVLQVVEETYDRLTEED